MAFAPKAWANSPSTSTPLSAAALDDLETRVTNIGWGGFTSQTGATYTAVAGDVVYANPASGNQTITLPSAVASTTVSVVAGSAVSNTNQITVSRAGGATISGKGLAAASSLSLISAGDNVSLASDGTNWYIVAGQFGTSGASIIATAQNTTSASYVTLTTPDQVAGLILPTSGLIAVWYWASCTATTQSGQAAIYLTTGGTPTQTQIVDVLTTTNPVSAGAAANIAAGNAQPLTSWTGGLGTAQSSAAYPGDVTTGQVLGLNIDNAGGAAGNFKYLVGSNGNNFSGTVAGMGFGGPCYLFAAAGTYTVSVRFLSNGGTITASNRRLYVQALPF